MAGRSVCGWAAFQGLAGVNTQVLTFHPSQELNYRKTTNGIRARVGKFKCMYSSSFHKKVIGHEIRLIKVAGG